MRYSIDLFEALNPNFDSLQVACCWYRNSFLKEDLHDIPYDYRKDPVINEFLQEELDYFSSGTLYHTLRRIEDTIVINFIPIINKEAGTIALHSIFNKEVYEKAKNEARKEFASIEDKLKLANQEAIQWWIKRVGENTNYFKNFEKN